MEFLLTWPPTRSPLQGAGVAGAYHHIHPYTHTYTQVVATLATTWTDASRIAVPGAYNAHFHLPNRQTLTSTSQEDQVLGPAPMGPTYGPPPMDTAPARGPGDIFWSIVSPLNINKLDQVS